MHRIHAATLFTLCAFFSTAGSAHAQSVLVLNGAASSTVQSSIAAAGFNVISGYLAPGEIASRLSVANDIVEIWIWNDGTFGNTGSPADPAYDFDASDLAALDVFHAAHPHWIMDGLSWRGEVWQDEINLTMNEALDLAAAGGGIVLGADDASGGAIVQHVNQVGAHFAFAPFIGTYDISGGNQHEGGAIFSAPFAVDPNVISSTFSYCDVPHGLQPNGLLLTTALFADMAVEDPSYPPNPTLGSEVFNNTTYDDVAHLVTTTLPGGGAPTHTVLILNGTGASSLDGVLASAGWNVISGTLDPGQIASNLAAYPSIEEIWIWSDGTYQAYDPARDFDPTDLAALDAFSAVHPHWIMDGLAWRAHTTRDEVGLSVNEASVLAAAGGGIVLGGDDDYDPFVLQHVHQVTAHSGFAPWYGVYLVAPSQALSSGSLFYTPLYVDPTNINATTSQPDVSSGAQPNGLFLSTALFCAPGVDYPGYTNPALHDEVIAGALYLDVDHLVTTTIPNAGFRGTTVAPFCSGDGSATACPCGNVGNAGSGCENSLGTGGGLLAFGGTPSVSGDTFELDGSGMSATGSVLYFQGTVAVNDAQGAPFGDGLRCVGGQVIRLALRQNSGGASAYGAPLGDTPISVKGAIPASGGTRFYQAWYRNAGAFCTPSNFNLTNGIAATWVP